MQTCELESSVINNSWYVVTRSGGGVLAHGHWSEIILLWRKTNAWNISFMFSLKLTLRRKTNETGTCVD